jgi:allantoinase
VSVVRAVRSRRVVLPDGVRPATIHIDGGTIVSVDDADVAPAFDCGDLIVMPGLVDTHVHVNEPGRTEWEGFETATRAAAAGGVTTVFDMPLNSIPATTSLAALAAKRAAARDKCAVDVGFLGGVVPGNAAELEPLSRAGVFGFKCFLAPSGVDEFPAVTERDLRVALPILASMDAVLMVHAELPDQLIERPPGDPRRYATYLASRPASAEADAIALVANMARELGARVHIVHVSSAEGVAEIQRARDTGVRMTAETCPHYLAIEAGEIADGATEFKCAPPIRDRDTRDALWRALGESTLDMIVSDHSPCPPALKCKSTGDFFAAWGGIASLQLGLPVVWTGARERGGRIGVERVAQWMSTAPARLAGLAGRKGAIAADCDADLVVWDPDASFVVQPEMLQQRHKITPYLGRTLYGVVHATLVGGRVVYKEGRFLSEPAGRLLARQQ